MPTISAVDCARLAFNVGIPNSQLITCVAIAIAESGLRTDAVGRNGPTQGCPGGSRDRGLWQINDCYHPDVNDACAFNPVCNAQAMFRISSRGSNWHPWSTFNNGLDPRIVTAANLAVRQMLSTTAGPPTPAGSPPVAGLADATARAIQAGANPLSATISLFQTIIDQVTNDKYGGKVGTLPVLGNIRK